MANSGTANDHPGSNWRQPPCTTNSPNWITPATITLTPGPWAGGRHEWARIAPAARVVTTVTASRAPCQIQRSGRAGAEPRIRTNRCRASSPQYHAPGHLLRNVASSAEGPRCPAATRPSSTRRLPSSSCSRQVAKKRVGSLKRHLDGLADASYPHTPIPSPTLAGHRGRSGTQPHRRHPPSLPIRTPAPAAADPSAELEIPWISLN